MKMLDGKMWKIAVLILMIAAEVSLLSAKLLGFLNNPRTAFWYKAVEHVQWGDPRKNRQ
jgi:hypothetical protein